MVTNLRKTLEKKKTPVETYLYVIRNFDSGLIGQVLKIIQMNILVCDPAGSLFFFHLCVITFKAFIKL